jgi:uncharacterized membrane protein YqjE
MVKELKEEKKKIIQDIFFNFLNILLFPLTGLCLFCLWFGDSIHELLNINKKIKIEKIKEIIRQATIIKDENGNIKDIKL